MKPQLVIFDFWKTLAFSPKSDPQKFYLSLGGFGIKAKDKEAVRNLSSSLTKLMCLSENWMDFSRKLINEFGEEKSEENMKNFAVFLKENMSYKLYDDVKEALNLPYKKAILTDSSRFLVENSELKDFGEIFTPAETKSLKPDPKVFWTVVNAFKLKPRECLMVGDDIERDLVSAKKIGMKTILIDRNNKFSNHQDPRINSFKELEKTIEGL